jgi:two-component system chemotaxis sensor kinase CheA
MSEDFLNIFFEEIQEHLPVIELALLELEKRPQNTEPLNQLFRSIHTIKGGAGLVGLPKVNTIAHHMESVLSLARSGELVLNGEHISTLLLAYDSLVKTLNDPQNSLEIEPLLQKLDSFKAPLLPTPPAPLPSSPLSQELAQYSQFYQVSLRLNKDLEVSLPEYLETLKPHGIVFDAQLRLEDQEDQGASVTGEFTWVFFFATFLNASQVQTLLHLPPSQIQWLPPHFFESSPEAKEAQESKEAEGKVSSLSPLEKKQAPSSPDSYERLLSSPTSTELLLPSAQDVEESIRVNVKRLNKLVDLAGELVLVRNQIFRLSEIEAPSQNFKNIVQNLNRITTEIQEEVMNTRMQPIGLIFGKSPRLVRELSQILGKKVELVTEGGEVELDKSMIEVLVDPMLHIIRNVMDHGIEAPEERLQKGKLPYGILKQKAFHKSGQVLIQMSDDGRGIDTEMICQKAIEKGILSREEVLHFTEQEKINIIFTPGFSSAKQVSTISGRGVGMDIVKNNIEKIGGVLRFKVCGIKEPS